MVEARQRGSQLDFPNAEHVVGPARRLRTSQLALKQASFFADTFDAPSSEIEPEGLAQGVGTG
jgi:hypothetical protein